MISNPKLNLKVLKEMNEDFIHVEASLIGMRDLEAQKKLFQECREHRVNIQRLINYYQKILQRQR